MYFDISELYRACNYGLRVFEYFYPTINFRDPRHRFKIRDEKTASARLSFYKNLWRITDFGNQDQVNGMPAFDWLMWRENFSFYDALSFVNQVILGRENKESFSRTDRKPDYTSRAFDPETDILKEYKFFFRDKPTDKELANLGRYVTPEIMKRFRCKSVERYEYASYSEKEKCNLVHIYTATPDYPIFLFDYKEFKKLYRPMEQEKQYRFLYIGEKPRNYIFGMEQLLGSRSEFEVEDDYSTEEEASPEVEQEIESKPMKLVKDLFRCSGESDALNLASLGFHVYWLNSESVSMDAEQFRNIDQYCERHYQIMDLDDTGRKAAAKNALRNIELYTVVLPEWIAGRRDWRGNACKDLKDFINLSGRTQEQTRYDFLVLKSNARRAKFWEKGKKDQEGKRNYFFLMEHFYFFLQLNGFHKIKKSYVRNADYMYVKIDGKKCKLIPPSRIRTEVKFYTKKWIEGKKMMNILPLLDKINTSLQITESTLDMIEEIDLNFRNADPHTEWLHFSDGMSMKITKDEIKMVRQDKVPNYILESLQIQNKTISHILPHSNIHLLEKPPIEVEATPAYAGLLEAMEGCKDTDMLASLKSELLELDERDRYTVIINDKNFYFSQFLRDLSRLHWRKETEHQMELTETEIKDESLALANLLFVYGYLCSEYKDPGKAWIVVTMDNKISEVGQSSGRSGKSLKTMGVRYVRPTFVRGGRDLDNSDNFKFLYDGFTEFHNNIEIDDFAEYGQFGNLYTQITGNREINPKNYSGFSLDYAHSGKMSLSTNFELHNFDSSTTARLLYETVSDYYHEKTRDNGYLETSKPDIKFGRHLYDDFTPEEWNKFYNLIAYSIQLQMRFYKISPPMENIERKELRREMQKGVGKTDDFFRWANTYFLPKPEDYPDKFSPIETGYLDTYINKEEAYNDLIKDFTPKQKNDYRVGRFKDHLTCWCIYYGYHFNPESLLTDSKNKRIICKIEGKAKECFYISTAGVKILHVDLQNENPENNLEAETGSYLPF